MHRLVLFILVLMYSTSSLAAGQEQRIIKNCSAIVGGEPVKTAICAGQMLSPMEIEICIKNECFGKDKALKQSFLSLYGTQLRAKTSCGNLEIKAGELGNQTFTKAQSWKLCSGYEIAFREDGNLVVYNKQGKAVWSSGTDKRGADKLEMQANGNLVIYKGQYPVWSSGTHGNPGSVLSMQDDGNLVIYNKYNKPIWATGTNNK
ncbi:MAG: hypothetical protein OEZ39_02425 [Gammaproteobacteria bacterium]|nr:hypothetical protein [Gammaproteobacteria bacterium]MDH5650710.1 hypothetical protein [Gammaproteobacteria bacterium]